MHGKKNYFRKRRDHKKIFPMSVASTVDRSLSYLGYISKINGKQNSDTNGLIYW